MKSELKPLVFKGESNMRFLSEEEKEFLLPLLSKEGCLGAMENLNKVYVNDEGTLLIADDGTCDEYGGEYMPIGSVYSVNFRGGGVYND